MPGKSQMTTVQVCPVCGDEFQSTFRARGIKSNEAGLKIYCSRECKTAHAVGEEGRDEDVIGKIKCQGCGELFEPGRNPRKTCSEECYEEMSFDRQVQRRSVDDKYLKEARQLLYGEDWDVQVDI